MGGQEESTWKPEQEEREETRHWGHTMRNNPQTSSLICFGWVFVRHVIQIEVIEVNFCMAVVKLEFSGRSLWSAVLA